jgi:hypothetical protein
VPNDDERELRERLLRLGWKVAALEAWRKDAIRRLAELELEVDNLTTKEEIARAVREELRQHPAPPTLAPWQRFGAILAGAVFLAASIKGLVP